MFVQTKYYYNIEKILRSQGSRNFCLLECLTDTFGCSTR